MQAKPVRVLDLGLGLFAKAEIEVLSEQLSKCKDTVTSVVATATLSAQSSLGDL